MADPLKKTPNQFTVELLHLVYNFRLASVYSQKIKMKLYKLVVPFAFLFFAACGGNKSADMAEHGEGMEAEAEEMAYDGPNADVIAELNEGSEMLLNAIDGLTPDQWVFQENPERWSIEGVTEHIIKAENKLRGILEDSVLTGEPMMEMPDSTEAADAAVRNMILDRSTKYKTSPDLEPTGVYATPEEAKAAFEAARAKTIEFLETTDKNLREYSRPFAEGMAPMDGAEWVIFMANHVKRHVKQIDQVKADPGYPSGM